jgi:hypothetical protein
MHETHARYMGMQQPVRQGRSAANWAQNAADCSGWPLNTPQNSTLGVTKRNV